MIGDPLDDPSAATRRLYAADWLHFAAWCRTAKHTPLPASPATLAAYLLALAPGLSPGTLGRHRAAIGAMHRQSGLPIPKLDAAARKALRGSAKPQASPRPTSPGDVRLAQMAACCPRDLAGLRDRAMLLLVAALAHPERGGRTPGASRAAAETQPVPRLFVLALDAEHIRLTAAGMTLQLHTRLDDAEPDRVASVTRVLDANACPVRALEEWLGASDTAFGPVFRKVNRWGTVEHGRLHPDAWQRILARRNPPMRRPRAAMPGH